MDELRDRRFRMITANLAWNLRPNQPQLPQPRVTWGTHQHAVLATFSSSSQQHITEIKYQRLQALASPTPHLLLGSTRSLTKCTTIPTTARSLAIRRANFAGSGTTKSSIHHHA